MGRVLAISSQVVRGHVGLSAIVPALQRLGHEVLAIPTILLSNHPGHIRAAGTRIEVNTLMSMLDVLDANGWLEGIDAVMTGYLPTPEHVYFAGQAIDLVRERSASAHILVDPVIGDDPRGLYIDPAAAASIRDDLVPRATILKPNRFELSWLSGSEVRTVDDAASAARRVGVATTVVTSIPDGGSRLVNARLSADRVDVCRVDKLPKVPHGTGDLLSGLLIGHHLLVPGDALGRAVGGVQLAIAASAGRNDLALAVPAGTTDWARAEPLFIETVP